MWLKSYCLANAANSCDEYCGPLSLLMISGIPCREKMVFRALIMACEVVLESFTVSVYLEK